MFIAHTFCVDICVQLSYEETIDVGTYSNYPNISLAVVLKYKISFDLLQACLQARVDCPYYVWRDEMFGDLGAGSSDCDDVISLLEYLQRKHNSTDMVILI